jgi:hypothetical protein
MPVHANVPRGASDLDHARLPPRWLAPLDVATSWGRALSSSVAIQPRADWPTQKAVDPFSRSLSPHTKRPPEGGLSTMKWVSSYTVFGAL